MASRVATLPKGQMPRKMADRLDNRPQRHTIRLHSTQEANHFLFHQTDRWFPITLGRIRDDRQAESARCWNQTRCTVTGSGEANLTYHIRVFLSYTGKYPDKTRLPKFKILKFLISFFFLFFFFLYTQQIMFLYKYWKFCFHEIWSFHRSLSFKVFWVQKKGL